MLWGMPEDGREESGQEDVATDQEGITEEAVGQDSLGAGEVIVEEAAYARLQRELHGFRHYTRGARTPAGVRKDWAVRCSLAWRPKGRYQGVNARGETENSWPL